MKLLIKVYEHQFDDTIIAQEIIDSQVEIKQELNSFATASFDMPLIKIEEYNIVEIYEVGNTDKRVFRGYVYKIEPLRRQRGTIKIECRSEKAIMNDRIVLSDKNYVDTDISTIIGDLLWDWNTDYNENWDFNVWITKQINLELKQWDRYYDIFDELCEQNELFWDIVDKKVIFTKSLGIDRTTWSEYQEVLYNGLFPNTANIVNIKLNGTATRKNILIGIGADNLKIKKQNFTDRVYWAGIDNFRDWDLEEKTTKKLEQLDKLQRLYEVEVEQNVLNANIWDKVKLVVENTNSYFDIDSEVLVMEKTIRYDNGSKFEIFSLWEFSVELLTIENWLYWVQKDLRLLKIK